MRNPPHLLSMYFAQLTLQKGLHKHVPYGLPILHHITRETSTSFCLMDCIRRVVHIARYSAQNLFVLYLGERSLSAQQRTYLCILLLPNPFDIEAEFKVLFRKCTFTQSVVPRSCMKLINTCIFLHTSTPFTPDLLSCPSSA